MKYIQTKVVYIDRDEQIEIKAIEHDIKTRFINFKFIGENKILDISHCIVRIYALNSKYNEVFNNLKIIDGAKGLAQLELTDALLIAGVTKYQLKIYDDNGGILSSKIFKLIVDKNLMVDNAIEGSNEYRALDEALKTVGELNSMKVSIGENTNAIKEHDIFMRESRKEINDNKAIFDKFVEDSREFDETMKETSCFNYVSNPIFSTGSLKGWELWGNGATCTVLSDTSLSHKYSLKIKCDSPSQGVTQTISGLVYGKHYTFKAKVWVESGTPGIMVRNDDSWGGAIFESSQGYNKWVELKMKFWAKEGTTPIYIGTVNNESKNASFWVSEIMLHEGYGDIPFIDNIKELYSEKFQVDLKGMVFGDGDGTYSNSNNGDLEYTTGGITNKYPALTYISAFSIPAGNPGRVNIKLPKEFVKRKSSLKWGVVPKGYYYNTSGNFFPFHVAVNVVGEAYEEGGFIICPVEGYCRIQNGANAGDVQNTSINAVLIALA